MMYKNDSVYEVFFSDLAMVKSCSTSQINDLEAFLILSRSENLI